MRDAIFLGGTDKNSNYVKKLMDNVNDNPWPKPGAHLIEIQHDRWCRIFKGKACNCDPDIVRK